MTCSDRSAASIRTSCCYGAVDGRGIRCRWYRRWICIASSAVLRGAVQGRAVFAGLDAAPKRSYLAAQSSGIGRDADARSRKTWFQHIQHEPPGGSCWMWTSTPCRRTARTSPWRSTASLSQKPQPEGDAGLPGLETVKSACSATRAPRSPYPGADEILRLVDSWRQQIGHAHEELVFDTQPATHAKFHRRRPHLPDFWSHPILSTSRLEAMRVLPGRAE
jgi:hypothetical protein